MLTKLGKYFILSIFRYNRWLPELPTWPAIDDVIDELSTTGCDRSSPANMTSVTSSFREMFDSTRFVVSFDSVRPADSSLNDLDYYWLPSTDADHSDVPGDRNTERERRVSSTTSGSNRAPKRQSLPPTTGSSTSPNTVDVWSSLLPMSHLFVGVDVLLVLFHLTRAYAGCRRMLRRYGNDDDDDDIDDEKDDVIGSEHGALAPAGGCIRNGGHGGNRNNLPTPAIAVDLDRSLLPTDRLIVADWTVAMYADGAAAAIVEYHRGQTAASATTTTSLGYSPLQPKHTQTVVNSAYRSSDEHTSSPGDILSASKYSLAGFKSSSLDLFRCGLTACLRVAASRALLPVFGCAALLVASQIAQRSTTRTLPDSVDADDRSVFGLDGLGALYARLRQYHVTASNEYTATEAAYLYDVMLIGCVGGIWNELINLQALVEYANTGSLRQCHTRLRRRATS